MRLPSPGTGAYDFGANLSFAELPKSIDSPAGFVANWNTKPAFGWLDGEGMGSTSRPGGAGQRVTSIQDYLATRSDWTFADLRDIDRHHGTTDHRAREYLPVIQAFRVSAAASLSEVEKAALDQMLAWDRIHYGPGIDLADESAKDGPAATLFGYYVAALRDELFADLRFDVLDPGVADPDPNNPDPAAGLTIYGRVSGVGSHVFDQGVMDNVIMRVLNPSSSGLVMQHDFTGGRSRDAIMLAALGTALQRLAGDFNSSAPLTTADLPKCTRVHPRSQICSLTGVIGPGSSTVPGTSCVTMPYQDRGSWVHRIGYELPPTP
jgi:penicillin amidase